MKYTLLTIQALIITVTVTSVSAFFGDSVVAWSYPVPQVSKLACRSTARDRLGTGCIIDLPVIHDADYLSYEGSGLYRSVYTVLRGASYRRGWDMTVGAHLGVDIASSRGTPVVSMGSGIVYATGRRLGWGNFVTIRHDGVYSTYAHMDTVVVVVGQEVNEGQLIGKVGDTGNATNNHLHRQLEPDIAGVEHPYYYGRCKAGHALSGWDIVQLGLCRPQLFDYTIDPIRFVETDGRSLIRMDMSTKTSDAVSVLERRRVSSREVRVVPLWTGVVTGVQSLQIQIPGMVASFLSQVIRVDVVGGSGLVIGSPVISYWDGIARDVAVIPLQSGRYGLVVRLGSKVIWKQVIQVRI